MGFDEYLEYLESLGVKLPKPKITIMGTPYGPNDWIKKIFIEGDKNMKSVIQDWAMNLPLRYQGTLLTGVRGCDDEPKLWAKTGVAYSPGRRLTAFIRYCFMNPADPREVDYEEGSFFQSQPPSPFKPSEFGHLPQHWYSHAMHSLEIIGYCHPDNKIKQQAFELYKVMVKSLHLNIEFAHEMEERLTEDRILTNTVVS